ncbi:MAG: hypothetical protein IBJ10_02235 [Phycisphaerales bacterium]|nr:hypothetical protein [Phycisphaerales bacterium]
MAEGRERSEWSRTAEILSLTFNMHRDPKRTPAAKASDFDPYAKPVKEEVIPADISVLKSVFIKGQKPRKGKKG